MDKSDLINKGADVTGSLAGAGVGLAVAGPPGALWGAIAGPVVTNVIKDVAKRALSSRERIRLDNAITYIEAGIVENINSGRVVRQDGFFEGDNNFSSNGAELLDGVLLKCRAQYQEKKVRLISNIFKNVAFDDSISPLIAHQILNLAEGLTYQNLCLLGYFARKAEFVDFSPYEASLSSARYMKPSPDWLTKSETWEVFQDMMSLYRQSLIKDGSGSSHLMADTLKPSEMVLEIRGQAVVQLMELVQIPQEDILAVVGPIGQYVKQ